MMKQRRPRLPDAFTLLEVMLALALTALVLIAITMAVDFQLRVVDAGRAQVEEAQLARAILRRIADDLRSAVRYDPMNVEDKVPSASLGNVAGSAGMSEDELISLAGESGVDTSDLSATSGSSSSENTGLPRSVPGLYGYANELQVDVSRLPRLDQFDYDVLPGESPVQDRVSDVKTVAYFMSDYAAGPFDAGGGIRGGLMRRELDRAVTSLAVEEGGLEGLELDLEPLAPEVAAVEFLYSDGTQWLDSWDSSSQLGLPLAVKIVLYILPARARREVAAGRGDSLDINQDELVPYTVTVHLPGSEPNENSLDWEDEMLEEEDTAADADTTSGG